jgi:manganese/iron transport system permease protein
MGWLEPEFMRNALLAGLCAGAACSVAGVFVVTMHLSFLGVCIAHAALAGALMGEWLEFNPIMGALAFSVGAAAVVGPLADKGDLSPDSSIGIVFSMMLGLGLLFLGLIPGSRNDALDLFWGSILTVTRVDVLLLAATAVVLVALVILFFKEIQAVICHRHVALAVGIPAAAVFYAMLVATGVTIAVSLRSVGGLVIFSLIVNPAAAAFQLTYSLKRMFFIAAGLGVLSCWAGLAASYFWDLRAGACIAIVSSVLFALAAAASPKRQLGWR